MKKIGWITVSVLALALFFSGCATFLPMEIKNLDQAIEKARSEGADKQCPDDLRQVVNMRNEAVKIYYGCRYFDAAAKAKAATEKAKGLCPVRKDSDGDGVPDDVDICPLTPKGVEVDIRGCPVDSDGDGVADYLDRCPGTPKGVRVDDEGCSLDSDGDGVADYLDKCPGTTKGVRVDDEGCPLDSDGDGVYDYLDKCPGTPWGVLVDGRGCPSDSDGDGVYDYLDRCPKTPEGATVDKRGCWVLKGVLFDTAKWNIKPKFHPILNEVILILKRNPRLKLEVQGHTDSQGSAKYNQGLSQNRAKAVMEYFVKRGVDRKRLSAKGYGLTKPVASNLTVEGRALNRRVELQPIY